MIRGISQTVEYMGSKSPYFYMNYLDYTNSDEDSML